MTHLETFTCRHVKNIQVSFLIASLFVGLRETDLCLQNTCVCTTISSYIFSYASALSNYLFHIFVNTLVNEGEKDRELYGAVHPFLVGLPLGGYSFLVLLTVISSCG